jgi:hypothetical protein
MPYVNEDPFSDPMCGVRLNDRHVVCYLCKRQSDPQPSMKAAMSILLAHSHNSPNNLPRRWDGQ